MPYTYELTRRLDPLLRLRNATAQLLQQAEEALSRGDGSQTRESVALIRRQYESFDARARQIARTLHPDIYDPLPPPDSLLRARPAR